MIAIVSSSPRECAALARLCEQLGLSAVECLSARKARRTIIRIPLRVMIVRHQLQDGYSDDVIAALADSERLPSTKVIVLLTAGISSTIEARQLSLGADCVQRDPVRSEVLLAYIGKYLQHSGKAERNPAKIRMKFAGALMDPLERTLQHEGNVASLTPREVAIIELLADSPGQIITYDMLYNEILGRRFRGDTSNMRVLLAKLGTSLRQIGLALPVEVIPKTGYRYRA